ncbi:MAG: shikimate dehydrogenase [Candidatus Bathyarchaeota archaeon]|nr:shikimate dehydrogenase [Candidatus Bathyarchaeota archaeon]
MQISGKTRICGVIGDPIEHSLSPTIQNSAFYYLGLDFVFLAFNVKVEELEAAIQGLKVLGIHGLNVTMPHKMKVISYLGELDPTVKFLGSANTIVNKKGKLFGFNTDGIGAVRALQGNDVDLASSNVLLLGAGGAGRSIALSIAEQARGLVILNRDIEKARRLELDLKMKFNKNIIGKSLSAISIKKYLKESDVLINATNVGMKPNQLQSIVDSSLLTSNLAVMDIVYNPVETKLLTDAKKTGARTINGIDMLIHQGAVSFELWTGQKAPIEVMKQAALKQLSAGAVN